MIKAKRKAGPPTKETQDKRITLTFSVMSGDIGYLSKQDIPPMLLLKMQQEAEHAAIITARKHLLCKC